MSDRLLLVDSDVFVLLAAAGRLDRAVELLEFPPDRVFRLEALPHMLRESIKGKSKKFNRFTVSQREEAIRQTGRFAPLPRDLAKDEQAERDLLPVIQFDAPLYATLVAEPLVVLHSGDSTAMKRVAEVPELSPVKAAVAGRLIALESILYLLIQHDQYEPTVECFRETAIANETVKWVFKPALSQMCDQLESARSYLRKLCQTVRPGFIHCPPCPESHKGVCHLPPAD